MAAYPKAGEGDLWFVMILRGVGLSLAEAGRFTDAETHLTQAATTARALQNAEQLATVTMYQAERVLFMGDVASAKALVAQAGTIAAKASHGELKHSVDLLSARIDATAQPSRALLARVGKLLSEAEARGRKAVGAACMLLREFPACSARRCDAHHIEHWVDGGPTTLDNLVLLCRRHHRLVHEGGFTVGRQRDRTVAFFYPDGTRFVVAPPQPRFDLANPLAPTPIVWRPRASPSRHGHSQPGTAHRSTSSRHRRPVRAAC